MCLVWGWQAGRWWDGVGGYRVWIERGALAMVEGRARRPAPTAGCSMGSGAAAGAGCYGGFVDKVKFYLFRGQGSARGCRKIQVRRNARGLYTCEPLRSHISSRKRGAPIAALELAGDGRTRRSAPTGNPVGLSMPMESPTRLHPFRRKGQNNHRIRVALKLFLVTFSLEKK